MCKIAAYAENPEGSAIPLNKACKKQFCNALHTLRRSWQTNQCKSWAITSENQSRKQNRANLRSELFFCHRRMLAHRRESAKSQFWIFRPSMALWSRKRKQRSTSRSLTLGCGYMRWNVWAIVGKTRQWTWLFLFEADRRNSQIIEKVRK